MAATQLSTRQIGDGTINRDDLNISTTGKAVATKIIAGTNISLSYTGVDSGTGDVTINASGGSGTVTSVNLALPSIFSLSGNPITTSGTITATLATQSANSIFSGPSSGGSAAPTFRALVSADIPNLDFAKITTGTVPITQGGTGQITKTAAFNALSPNTTKGDLEVHNGTDNVRIGVGTNEQYLVADSTQSSGIKWYSPSAINASSISDVTNSTTAFVNKMTQSFTPSETGTYKVSWSCEITNENIANDTGMRLQEAGTLIASSSYKPLVANTYCTASGFALRTLTAATAYSYTIDFKTNQTGRIAHIRNVYLEIIKL